MKFYVLTAKYNYEDITNKLASDETIPLSLRQKLIDGKRRIAIFKYDSDGNQVAGYLSYIPHGEHPLIIFLRGGNGKLGIMRPNNLFSFFEGYNVIGTLYRGNVYGGEDEYGGSDINDVENLIRALPVITQHSSIQFKPPFAMMGVSRGSMQMFTSLAHSRLVSVNVNKAISISGNLDLNVTASTRPEMKYLFNEKFKKQQKHATFGAWLHHRNPVSQVSKLAPSLQALLIYGSRDNRVAIAEQKNLIQALQTKGIKAKLVVFPDANHGMSGHAAALESVVGEFLRE